MGVSNPPGRDPSGPVKVARGGPVGRGIISGSSIISKGFGRMDLSPRARMWGGERSRSTARVSQSRHVTHIASDMASREAPMVCAAPWNGKGSLKLEEYGSM